MKKNIKKKNILIVGSNGLVGKDLVKYLEKENHNVFKIDISNKYQVKNFFRCDITNEKEVIETLNKINKKKKIDVLFNAASQNPKVQKINQYKFTNYLLKDWKRNLEVDLIGSFIISKHLLKYFEKKNRGKIINISSIYGLVGPDQDIYYKNKRKKFYGKKPLEYSVAKAGIIGFSKALASYYKDSEIDVFCLIFGGIEEKQDKNFVKNYSKKTIIGRMIKKGEYNSIINYLVTNNTRFLSGSCIDMSAGALNIL